jgi:hypothetical protein
MESNFDDMFGKVPAGRLTDVEISSAAAADVFSKAPAQRFTDMDSDTPNPAAAGMRSNWFEALRQKHPTPVGRLTFVGLRGAECVRCARRTGT